MPKTLVIQSHRQPVPARWIEQCLGSVRDWAYSRGFEYRFIGDGLFELLPADLRTRTDIQTVVRTDLARLLAIRAALEHGFDAAIWCDADCVCFAPDAFDLPETDFALGREVWIQQSSPESDTLRAYVKVHNAFLLFRKGNSFLDFYIGAAQRLLRALNGPCPPQFIGPKFLTAVNNIALCPVAESAGMLSPPVIEDVLQGGGPALDLFRSKSSRPVAMANVCASLVASGEISQENAGALVDLLLERAETV